MEINQSQEQSPVSLIAQLMAILNSKPPLSARDLRRREILCHFCNNTYLSNSDVGNLLGMNRDSAAQWTRELKDLRYITISHKVNHVIFYKITERGRNLIL